MFLKSFSALQSFTKRPSLFASNSRAFATTMDPKRAEELIKANQLSMTTWAKQRGVTAPLMVGAEGCYTYDHQGRQVLDIFAS